MDSNLEYLPEMETVVGTLSVVYTLRVQYNVSGSLCHISSVYVFMKVATEVVARSACQL